MPNDSHGALPQSPKSRIFIDAVLAALTTGLVLALALGTFVPGVELQIVAPRLDLALETVTTGVATMVGVLAWLRWSQGAGPEALFQAAAFLVLAIANGLTVALMLTGLDARAGMALSAPGQGPYLTFSASRLLAVALLIAGGVEALRGKRPRWPRTIVVGSAIAIFAVIAVIDLWPASLPWFGVFSTSGPMPAATLAGAALQATIAGLFILAAALFLRLHRRNGSIGHLCLAVGLLFGAFAQADAGIHPSTFTGLVTGGDMLRLAFDVTLLIGIQAEVSATLSRLRIANSGLERLRSLEVERAALEERTHLSRELHDGLAQDLWLAKLKAGYLGAQPDLAPEAERLIDELQEAIDSGLAEAQQAVTALRAAGAPSGPLWEVVARYVEDFADRFGLRAEVECPSGQSGLPPRAEAELLRIAQEALSNVRRHADATVVRVHASVEDGKLDFVVGDNGRGFDPQLVEERAFGLASMRERTALLGGELQIESRPHDGTRVHVQLPVAVPIVTSAPEAAATPSGLSA